MLMHSQPKTATSKRDLDEMSWRVRKPESDNVFNPILDAEPRVEQSHVRPPASQPKKHRKMTGCNIRSRDPLETAGQCASRSKEQVDSLEKLLHSAMPPRVVLDNAFAGLRNAIADEIEYGMELQWRNGVKHADWLSEGRINDLQIENRRIRDSYEKLQGDYTKMLAEAGIDWIVPPPPALSPSVWEPEPKVLIDQESTLASELAKWLDETLDDQPSHPQVEEGKEIDLEAMSREINTISNLLLGDD